jgi:lipid-A-disaccharide synthase
VSRTLLVVAGEDSGDLHGAALLRELKARRPDLRLVGVGGPRMTPLLDRKVADVSDLAVMGFVEVIRHLPRLNRIFKAVLAAAQEERVDGALLIDYPGFNLRLAKALRQTLPRAHRAQFVCPQVWAWKKGRIPDIGNTLQSLYCLFDFEPELFQGYPVDARFLGHPLVDLVAPEVDRATFFSETGLDPARPLVALLPGSRPGEVSRLMPAFTALAKAWATARPEVQWALPVAPTLSQDFVRGFLGDAPVALVEDRTYAVRAHADAALVASGTATLETALLDTPMAIVYRMNPLTYQIGRRLVQVAHVGIPNLVARRGIVTELLQDAVSPARLGQELTALLTPEVAARQRRDLAEVRGRLGQPGAAGRVAEDLLGKL